jgi:hypothetical protein
MRARGPQANSEKRSKTMMGQIPEAQQNEITNAHFGTADPSDGVPLNAVICVYGHGPTKNPFYEEARAVMASPEGGLLFLSTAVSRGQRLLLLNGPAQNAVEALIVRTRTLGAQMFEVEVAFSSPHPEFWQPLRGHAGAKSVGAREAKKKDEAEKRRFPRMNLPRGMTVAWQASAQHDISRVASLSVGGLFIEAADPAPIGEMLQVQFDIPGGVVRAHAVVRRSIEGKGMGVEFTDLPAAARTGLDSLLHKLLGNVSSRKQ